MKIAQYRVEEFLKKIKTFNNKAKKLGLPEVVASKIGSEVREYEYKNADGSKSKYYIEWFEYNIDGSIPRLGGWAIHSKIEPASQVAGNFVYTNKGFEPREDLRTTGMVCEHCNMSRARSLVYLLQNMETGEQKLVGKSCLKDFLPELPVTDVLAYLESLKKLSTGEGDEDVEYNNLPRDVYVYPVDMLVAESLVLIRKWGYISKKAAREQYESTAGEGQEITATASLVANTNDKARRALYPEHEIAEIFKSGKVEACIEWMKAQDTKSDFMYNLKLAVEQAAAPFKMFAFVVAGVSMFLRATEEKVQKETVNKVNEFIGVVGQREEFHNLKIVREYVSQGQFGSTFITTMEDEDGRCVVWFASKRVGEIGDTINLKATIREHKMFNDLKQTVITRGSHL